MRNWIANAILLLVIAASVLILFFVPPLMDGMKFVSSHSYLRIANWSVVTTLILTLTLWVLLIYAKDTWRIADLQRQELGLRKRPIVSFHSRKPNKVEGDGCPLGELLTKVKNHSNVHALARITASILLKNEKKWTPLKEWHKHGNRYFYSGERTWSIQAGTTFTGSLYLRESLPVKGDGEIPQFLQCGWLRVESSVMGFAKDGVWKQKNAVKNPDVYFQWKSDRKRWEPAPDGPELGLRQLRDDLH